MDFNKAAALTFANICMLRDAQTISDRAALFDGFRHAYVAGIEYLDYFKDRFDVDSSPTSEPAPANKTTESNQPRTKHRWMSPAECVMEAVESKVFGLDELASIATPENKEKTDPSEQPITRITVEIPGALEADVIKSFAKINNPQLTTRFAILNPSANIKIEYLNIG